MAKNYSSGRNWTQFLHMQQGILIKQETFRFIPLVTMLTMGDVPASIQCGMTKSNADPKRKSILSWTSTINDSVGLDMHSPQVLFCKHKFTKYPTALPIWKKESLEAGWRAGGRAGEGGSGRSTPAPSFLWLLSVTMKTRNRAVGMGFFVAWTCPSLFCRFSAFILNFIWLSLITNFCDQLKSFLSKGGDHCLYILPLLFLYSKGYFLSHCL